MTDNAYTRPRTSLRSRPRADEGPEVRIRSADEWDPWFATLLRAFGGTEASPEGRQLWHDLAEPERSLGAYDGTAVVGTAGALSLRVAVPGGSVVPMAGVAMVGVLPTHRRRGLLTALMRRLLDDSRERGEPLAGLTASEPAIYGRFGYGLATQRIRLAVPRHRVSLTPPPDSGRVRLRLVDPAEAAAACEQLYAARVPLRPGMLERQPGWERLPLLDPLADRNGCSPLQCVLAEDPGTGLLLGYARYAVRPEWDASGPRGTVEVRDVEAADPAGYAALWSYLMDIDLTETVVADSRPVDDPLLHLVSDARRCEARLLDGLFLRPVDVGAALEARRYAAPVDVVLDVVDAFCPWNTGRWRLSGDAKGASCLRTGDPAELALTVRELGTAYLGGTTLAALAAAGRVREVRAGALAAASRAFTGEVAPWLPHSF
ncbi:GNAT family N-acetyltransferase [Peterkaempfera bronchialis]|uniref:GNAT family N-acetyltransferase n=1 Tax=Peterkaempfera bronchialis TaxID=2126346 RepID=A0A345SV14_9ACTN|nr:GNAT family N-acetyltransferase [Peterkaempfera bronchialis]AXI77569.1 GNAT family N-acetyltransferase [Peterkaempfera bronchialis]